MFAPKSLSDIEKMIRDQVQENIHLDYKDSRAVRKDARDDFAKDVSAFANSDGGVLIYGVGEKDHLPVATDQGVDDGEISREWIESAIMTGINPRIEDIRILPIPISPGRSFYVIEVQKSFRGPHQASPDKRYYKRHNFMSTPMEDYEIADVKSRTRRLAPLVSFDVGFYRDFIAVFDVANVGNVTAEDVRFEFSAQIPWPDHNTMPLPLSRGIRRLAPRQRLRFRYFTSFDILSGKSGGPMEFDVRASYFHPELNGRTSDDWPINFEAYRDSMHVRSEMETDAKEAIEAVKKLTESVEKLRSTLEPLTNIAGATGLELSALTLRNISRVLKDGTDPEPIDPEGQGPNVFRDVLGVDREMAVQLYSALNYRPNPGDLAQIPGMDDALLSKIRSRFILKPDRHS
ncbi:MAG: ATP-binding protein [Bryobacteraceae bacterium]